MIGDFQFVLLSAL